MREPWNRRNESGVGAVKNNKKRVARFHLIVVKGKKKKKKKRERKKEGERYKKRKGRKNSLSSIRWRSLCPLRLFSNYEFERSIGTRFAEGAAKNVSEFT